ncbi:hypothetical protein M3661_29260 [Paenibacillus sp. MER 180]|uniref:hypothetical protein n=1 Tax=Paenibacillus TaxID=44249 RepID=UPI002040D323|nr:hypothetical protein [Paenibacillus sp. MER 180]MCM3294189.1 hypothetical protein [Paenibacillus sp. MER 180]
MKKVSITSMILLLICSLFVSAVSADADNIPQPINKKPNRVPFELLNQSLSETGNATITITDPQKLKEIAVQDGLQEVPKKVEYEYVPIKDKDQNSNQFTTLADVYFLTSQDKGRGHYSSSDMYKEFYVYGPDNFTISESTKKHTYFDGEIKLDVSVLEAKVGIKIGTERDVRWSSTTEIKKGEKIRFQLYTTWRQINYWEWFGPNGNTSKSKCTGYGTVYDPDGQLIKKVYF